MKNKIILSTIIGMLCLAQQGIAADLPHSADHDALRILRDKVEKSFNSGDMNELRTCLAKDFTFITSDQTVITDMNGIVAYWDKMFKNKNSPLISMQSKLIAAISTKFTGPDTGYCHGTSQDIYTLKNKRKIAINNKWSAVLINEEGVWKISAAHIGVNFLDNPVLKAKEMSWFARLCVGLHLRNLPGEVKGTKLNE
ncbi:MAG: nuclear transport factor 2 family protein [Candidatus Omnitrophica bacterium]|nr:nuclear transport factor 2 family protein [Candidatus Omnitrophota bacterium]